MNKQQAIAREQETLEKSPEVEPRAPGMQPCESPLMPGGLSGDKPASESAVLH